jgi:serine protease Do
MKSKKYLIICVSVLCLALLAGCSSYNAPSTKPAAASITPTTSGSALSRFADLAEKIAPSVVAITTESVTYDSYNSPHTQASAGSGWILDANGTIVTNNHVVEGAKTITVEFADHRAVTAVSFTTDQVTDVATVKVDPSPQFPPLTVADTTHLRVGDLVMVMGNPLGLGISAKQGIISRLGVSMASSPEQVYSNLIETSAAINPGNSGGPMVNMDGEVIGITSLKIDATGIEGMGYAITISDVVPIIQVLAKGQPYPRAWLGASLTTVDNGTAMQYNLPTETGAMVVSVSSGSPADKAKMAKGDTIIGFDNTQVSDADQLTRLINSSKVGQKVKLTFWQGTAKKSVEIALATTPPTPSALATPTPTP